MSLGPSYRVSYRRRREGRTDYRARRALVLSRIPRFIVRGSLRNMTVQIAEAQPKGDRVISSANSRELIKTYSWRANCGNLPSAYLTGLLCGLRAEGKGVKKAILDIGLFSPTKGSRIFAALKGALDAGLDIPCAKEKLPSDKQISGQHIIEYAQQLSTKEQERYQKQFSQYLKEEKLQPEQLSEHFAQTREKIEKSFKPSEEERKPEIRAKTKEKPKAKPLKPKARAIKPKTARNPRKKKTEEIKE